MAGAELAKQGSERVERIELKLNNLETKINAQDQLFDSYKQNANILSKRVSAEAKLIRGINKREMNHSESKVRADEVEADSPNKTIIDEEMHDVEKDLNERESRPLEKVWEDRRKRTLILKGLNKPNNTTVLAIVQQYNLAKPDEIERISFRNFPGRGDWVFIVFKEVQSLEASFRNRANLTGTRFFIQKDRSFEERKKWRESISSQGLHNIQRLPSADRVPIIPLTPPFPPHFPMTHTPPLVYPNEWMPWGIRTPQIIPQWPLHQLNQLNQRHFK